MTESEAAESIWRQIRGAEELREIYGYFPTLHDADVTAVEVDGEARQIVFSIRYCDLIETAPAAINRRDTATTAFQIHWRRVRQAQVKMLTGEILHVSLGRVGDLIETRFDGYDIAVNGSIVARDIAISGVQIISETNEQNHFPPAAVLPAAIAMTAPD